ncbi:fimbrial protein [Burkholderia sp. LMG 32019]|uniref:fimbrial protein n=1 Tax=Burkholderia sp. LMG 32019 TaxID=3158173 RepID=UPI003C2C8940
MFSFESHWRVPRSGGNGTRRHLTGFEQCEGTSDDIGRFEEAPQEGSNGDCKRFTRRNNSTKRSCRGSREPRYTQGSATPLGFGPDSSKKWNTNQWLAGTLTESSDGNLTIPLFAKYVKTEPKITPGSVNARASFTLSYQ